MADVHLGVFEAHLGRQTQQAHADTGTLFPWRSRDYSTFQEWPCCGRELECCLQISFVEIHQDDVRDLLGDGENYAPIHVRESPERGTYLENAQ